MSEVEVGPAQVATFLAANPGFISEYLSQHQDALAKVSLPSGHGGRAISLHERQLEVLREKNRALEHRLADLMRLGQENDLINDKMSALFRQLLLTHEASALPAAVLNSLEKSFLVPQVALRVWGTTAAPSHYVVEPAAPQKLVLDAMHHPYCGAVKQAPAELWAQVGPWLVTPGTETRSVAILPLRQGVAPTAFGVILLGSADANRFTASMGTLFLERIAQACSAALSRLMAA
jgi:uncharacterized protein